MAARIERGRAQLLTRTGLDWTAKYPSMVAALAEVRAKAAYLDGEAAQPSWRLVPSDSIQIAVQPTRSSKFRDQTTNSLTFSSSSTWAFSAVSHICSTVIESKLARKVSPALRTAGSITRSSRIELARRSSGSAVLSDIAVRTISPTVIRRRSRANS